MENKKSHLSLEERQIIYTMHGRGVSNHGIAEILGRHRCSIGRELKRNVVPKHLAREMSMLERAKWGHDQALRRRSACKKGRRGPLKLVVVREHIEMLLSTGHYSPEGIADDLRQSDFEVKVCGKTIRRWLVKEAPELRKELPQRGKARRNRLTPRKKRRQDDAAPEKRSIHERPEIVESRDRIGDLEGDMIVSKKSKTAILSVIDRKTRRRWYQKTVDLKAETVIQALISLLLEIPPTQRHTITFDRGGEFAEWKKLELLFGMTVYFCDPYCAWQKGSVERANKEFRRFVPKGTDLSLVSDQDIARIEQVLNMKPMDCLGKFSAYQSWHREGIALFLH